MPERGTFTFADLEDFEAAIRVARFDVVLTGPGRFQAGLTCVELRNLHLLRGREELPRIAVAWSSWGWVPSSICACGV